MPPDRPSLGVDVALGELREKLATLLAARGDQQDFAAIWIARSEISKLEKDSGARARAAMLAQEQADTKARKLQDQLQQAEAAAQTQQKRVYEAERMIANKKLALCSRCKPGLAKIKFPDCCGVGSGKSRMVDQPVTAVCSDLRPACRFCGGMGVFTAARKKLVTQCAQCNGAGEVWGPCPVCFGRRIVNWAGTPVEPPADLRESVMKSLENRRGQASL
jgi:hypothetical protein